MPCSHKTLNEKYGPLRLLNGGRGIAIFDKRGKAVMEVDGLVMNTTCVLLNECKTALSDKHVVGAPPTAADPAQDTRKMRRVSWSGRDECKSNAVDALRVCAGKRVVPVASGFFTSQKQKRGGMGETAEEIFVVVAPHRSHWSERTDNLVLSAGIARGVCSCEFKAL